MRGLNLCKTPDVLTLSLFDEGYLERLQNERKGTVTPKTQRQQIVDALQKPMAITELYQALPHISPNNIAPLVRYLFLEKLVFKVGTKKCKTEKGIMRELVVWSSREEDKPCEVMNSLFGNTFDPSKLKFTGYVVRHLLDDAKNGIKTKVR